MLNETFKLNTPYSFLKGRYTRKKSIICVSEIGTSFFYSLLKEVKYYIYENPTKEDTHFH